MLYTPVHVHTDSSHDKAQSSGSTESTLLTSLSTTSQATVSTPGPLGISHSPLTPLSATSQPAVSTPGPWGISHSPLTPLSATSQAAISTPGPLGISHSPLTPLSATSQPAVSTPGEYLQSVMYSNCRRNIMCMVHLL